MARLSALRYATALLGVAVGMRAAETPLPAEIRRDVQLRAMLDELQRSKTLHLKDLDEPYFVQYSVSDSNQLTVTASLGGITSSNRLHLRQPRVAVRVGSYKFDNTNSVFSREANSGLFPVDDNYGAMRTALWLLTDASYKAATDEIARKRNALREIAEPDPVPDFAPAKPTTVILSSTNSEVDQQAWESLAGRLSGRFRLFPEVATSNVRLRQITSTYRVANTEGTVIRIPQDLADIEIRATALAGNGTRVWNHRLIALLEAGQLPSEEDLNNAVDSVARETRDLTRAAVAEDYTGPVLFEGEAAAEMMAQVLTDALRLQRKPLAPPEEAARAQPLESVWASRAGAKVAPDWLTIVDDARERSFHGQVLAGQYDVDDEGVPATRVTLVEKGTLKNFLSSREPVAGYDSSNGHGRLPGPFESEQAVIGNLFVQAAETVSGAALKAKLIENVKAAGLKYGLLIRRLDFPSTARVEELEGLEQQLQKNGYSRTLTPPLLAFRVYPDGREELVRGFRFGDFSAKNLRALEGASSESFVLNYITNGSAFNIADAGSDATLSSVVCPSLLFNNVELLRADNEAAKAPAVPPPALITRR